MPVDSGHPVYWISFKLDKLNSFIKFEGYSIYIQVFTRFSRFSQTLLKDRTWIYIEYLSNLINWTDLSSLEDIQYILNIFQTW